MTDLSKTAANINILGRFCGMRDVPLLTKENLQDIYGIDRADVLILFGGSILCGGEVAATAMKAGAADKFMICGGVGHTTETLRQKIHEACPNIETAGKTEAELFSDYIDKTFGIKADLLERESTNCGNNVEFSLDLIRRTIGRVKNSIIIQDATMQRRMDAGFRNYAGSGMRIINFAAYEATVIVKNGTPAYKEEIPGMWDINRYCTLLMGEIPRLTDNETGYGPAGRKFIAHVTIPPEVQRAFDYLHTHYEVRPADSKYAGQNMQGFRT
ncbi:MAG: YdcF family protein [Treponema sp.]|nr:YdcF family protein [Treponema sp.]